MKGVSYFRWWGFSINEGGSPVNIHVRWKNPVGFYFSWYGRHFSWLKNI